MEDKFKLGYIYTACRRDLQYYLIEMQQLVAEVCRSRKNDIFCPQL